MIPPKDGGQVGQTISHYKILEKLGEGGMGVVYKAQDMKLDRIVALKFLPHHLTTNEAEQARLLQEAKAASALNHPHVCNIHSIGEHEGQNFIDMEFIEGQTLRTKAASGTLKPDDAILYAVQIGEALHEAHSRGIVHRDIKSENIMVNSKNKIKVMDFGLAKLKGSLKLTRTSSTVGTLAYMAPEQLHGGEVDARSDIFSFGVVLFETLTGKLPFRGEHEAAMMYSIVNEDCDSVQKYRQDASPELDRIIRRALEKDPEDRYQHVDDMTSELRRLLKQSSRVSRPVPSDLALQTTQSGAVQQQQVSGNTPVRRKYPSRDLYLALAAVAVILAGIVGYMFVLPHAKTIDSLAVLPFENASNDQNMEYLSDGITESIINSLTKVPDLRVIPRSTVFRFKGKDVDPQEVGTKLKVHAVLAGRITRQGDDLNVQVDLIDVEKQSQLWGQQYRRNTKELLALQDEITSEVSNRLRLGLSGEVKKSVTKRYTENPEAYKLYLQGRYYWNKRRALEIQKAIECFNQALALDASYALAYVGLADCYALLEQYAGMPGKETYPKAFAAATHALEIDNSLAEAHATLGFANLAMYNWEESEKEFKISISLNPNYPTTYHWYSILLYTIGRREEAFKNIERAQELDPLSPIIGVNVAIGHFLNEDYETALHEMSAVLAIDSSFALAYYRKAPVYIKLGKMEEAYAAALKGAAVSGRSAESLSYLAYCAALLRKRDEALSIVKELEQRYANGTCPGYYVARVYAGLGDDKAIFKWLDATLENHSGAMIWLPQEPEWDPYRSDPRFVDLLKKIGLKK